MAELYSCYQFNSSTHGKDGLMPISMNMSLDRAILHFETCLIAQYALENYPEELLKKNTLSCRTDTTMKKYCTYGKKPDLFCEELSFRDESKDNDRGMSVGDFETVKKCSDILAFVEFYINRLTSLNDDLIKNNMTSARHLLAHFADFRKDSPKDFKDNPLIFNIEGKNDTYRAHQDICNVKSVIFDKFDHVNRSSPKVKKVFFHDELNTVGKGYYVGFGDLFEVIRDNPDVNLYVSLIGALPEGIKALHESYWKGRDEQQLTSSRKLIPLDELVKYLSDLYEKMRDGTELGRKLRYVIDRDEMDFRYGTLSPLNPFIGHLRPRDEDFETSHSSTSRI